MNPIFAALAAAVGRRPRERAPGSPSLVRLLVDELAWATRQAVHPLKLAAATVVAVGVGLVLGPTTPGPVLGAGWRLGLAVVLGFVALSLVHSLLQHQLPREESSVPLDGLRIVVAVGVALVVTTFVVAYLLAVVTGAPEGGEGAGLSASLAVDGPLFAVSGLLLAGLVTAAIGNRLALPGSLLFLALGMVVGSDGLGWIALDDPALVQAIGVVALVVILFDGGLTTSPRDVRLGTGPGLALATVGVAVTAGVTAVGAMTLLDVPSRAAWLLGAIVASTDASAVFAVLRRVPVPPRLAAILQVESGANDPVAILLTVGLLASWDAPPTATAWLGFGATQLLGGVVVGLAVGWLGARAMRTLDLGEHGLYPLVAFAVAGIAYGATVAVGGSGFLAVYLAGVVVGSGVPRRRLAIRAFAGALSSGVEVGLFLLLGLLVFPSRLPEVAVVSLGVALLLALVARPIGVAVSLAFFDVDRREQLALAWLGMRGAVPIVLATLAFSAGLPEADTVFDVVFFVVLASTLLQGTTAAAVVRRLGLGHVRPPSQVVVDAVPIDDLGIDVLEVDVTLDSPLVGRRLAEVSPSLDVLLVALVRGDAVEVPRGDTVLRPGDRVAAATRDQEAGRARMETWIATGTMPPPPSHARLDATGGRRGQTSRRATDRGRR